MQKIIRIIRLISFAVILLFNLDYLFAGETGKIAGKVLDAETGLPLLGANVVVEGTQTGAATDLYGDFFILNVFPGHYNISVSYMGYITERRTNVFVQIDKTAQLEFALKPQVLEGKNVVVVAQVADRVERDLTATKQSYDVGSLESIAGMNDIGDIINLQADVDGDHFRGGRTGEALYLVGGVSIVNPLTNDQSFEPLTIGLEQVEVYTSGFSAEYGNVQSGVVNMVMKEGSSHGWETHLDVSSTNAYYKNWGGSVYSSEYNDFFNLLNSTEAWADSTDPVSGVPLWTHFGIQFPTHYIPETKTSGFPPVSVYPTRDDTLRAAKLVKTLWLQSVRQMGLEYAKPDYRVVFSTGGPIAENTTLFVAGRMNLVNFILPTDRPDMDWQVMSNIAYKPNASNKIKLIYNFNTDKENDIPSRDVGNFMRWFDNTLYVRWETSTTHQIGLHWNHVFNPSTFMDLKVGQFFTHEEDHVDLMTQDSYTTIYMEQSNWRHYAAPTGYEVGRIPTSMGYEKSRTFSFDGCFTSQMGKYNLIKSGIQFISYDFDVNNRSDASNSESVLLRSYDANPFEGAVYMQDKMEFEGLIANLGLRYDFYNLNTTYFTDKFSPYRNPNYDPTDPILRAGYDEELANKKDTRLKTILQPRIGISFPVSEKTVLHLNYGVFTQRPAFERIYYQDLNYSFSPYIRELGNPLLEPERTLSYDVGIVRYLPFGTALHVSAYLKDVNNLLQYVIYEDTQGNRYSTYINREYADIKGFHVNLEKKSGFISWYIRYNWEAGKGKSGAAEGSGERAEYIENDPTKNVLPGPEDIYLDTNRKQKLVCNIRLKSDSNTGFQVFGIKPLANMSLSGTYRLSSGRPFTYDISGFGLQMNKRTPDERLLSARIEKNIPLGLTTLIIYVEGFNLLNSKIYDYGNTFEDERNEENQYKRRYMEDRDNLHTWSNYAPFVSSMDTYLLSVAPRHYCFGLKVNF